MSLARSGALLSLGQVARRTSPGSSSRQPAYVPGVFRLMVHLHALRGMIGIQARLY